MSQKKKARETQHYVPQMMLRRFASKGKGKIDQINVFDKRVGRTFRTGTNNILAENNFYDISERSMEPALSQLESEIAPIFEKIISEKSLGDLKEEDRLWLSAFTMTQHIRVKSFRKRQQEMTQGIIDKFGSVPGMTEQIMEEFTATKDDAKQFSMEFLAEDMIEMSEYILNKDWQLLETSHNNPFWIADNPVTLYNDNNFKPYPNIGFGVKGIQIHLPLSPTLMIAFWCPTIRHTIEETLKKSAFVRQQAKAINVMANPPLLDPEMLKLAEKAKSAEKIIDAIKTGNAKMVNDQNILFYNSLQYKHAEQYIVSSSSDMSFAKDMYDKNPEWQSGPRIQVN